MPMNGQWLVFDGYSLSHGKVCVENRTAHRSEWTGHRWSLSEPGAVTRSAGIKIRAASHAQVVSAPVDRVGGSRRAPVAARRLSSSGRADAFELLFRDGSYCRESSVPGRNADVE
jgi:hypothetical protein